MITLLWILVGILMLLILYLGELYRRGLSERRNLQSLIIMILLHERVFKSQRDGLVALVDSLPKTNGMDLTKKVFISTCELANRLASANSGSSLLGAHSALWELKNRSSAESVYIS